jgi:alpha-ketoglutarate-dependent taurine dioxygenase
MLRTYKINNNKDKIIKIFSEDWKNKKNKVFHFTNLKTLNTDVRNFYEFFFSKVVNFKNFAEDAKINNRSKQRTNSIWMEVRFDPKIKNAYRHSSNPQPLHTDGSYIKNYTNSTLMCCVKNNTKKGETIFISAEKIKMILQRRDEDLLTKILESDVIHTRSGDIKKSKIIYQKNKMWRTNWNFFCVDKEQNSKIKLMANKFKYFLEEDAEIRKNILSIKMKSGDALVWKDNEVLHGRNGFIATNASDRFIWKCAANFNE